MLYKILLIIIFISVSTWTLAADEAKGILPISLISGLKVTQVHEYTCARNMQCQVRCAAQSVQEPFNYQNVRRLEIAQGEIYWVIGAVYVDPIGKGHIATGILPQPVSCIIDDLRLTATMPVVEGNVVWPSSKDEVIFDVQPLD